MSSVGLKSEPRYPTRASLWCAVALSAWLASACGGRWRTITEVPDDDNQASGGASGALGASGASSHGGQTATAGAPGAAGACANLNCPAQLDCVEGTKPVTLPGNCCPSCEPVCKQLCLSCAPGFHSEGMPGACCPTCVADQNDMQCAAGRATYADVRERFLYKYGTGCASDAECSVVAPSNRCEAGCQYASVWYGGTDSFTENLQSEADLDCAACPVMMGVLPCPPPPPPRCVMGQCELGLN